MFTKGGSNCQFIMNKKTISATHQNSVLRNRTVFGEGFKDFAFFLKFTDKTNNDSFIFELFSNVMSDLPKVSFSNNGQPPIQFSVDNCIGLCQYMGCCLTEYPLPLADLCGAGEFCGIRWEKVLRCIVERRSKSNWGR